MANNNTSNYISANKVFILDKFYPEKTNEMIGDLADMVMKLPVQTKYTQSNTLVSPYDTYELKNPIIDVYINSSGGELNILNSIAALLSTAKNRGAIIRTTVLSRAYSCGSLLAIQGTPGYRIMYDNAQHLVHFGAIGLTATKESEIEIIKKRMENFSETVKKTYRENTNLTEKDLKKLMSNEQGYLSADQCLAKNLCDWVIDSNGNFRGHTR